MKTELNNKAIIFYDGDCALCNWSVQFLIKNDKQNTFTLISLQHPLAKKLLNKDILQNENSVILFIKGNIFTKSTAVINTFSVLGNWWRIFVVFKFIPKTIRDNLYDFVAKNRKKWFGSTNYCRLPNRTLYF